MITDIKDLQHVLKLCRKYGLTDIVIGSFSARFGELPSKQNEIQEDDIEMRPSDSDKFILEQLGLNT